MIYILGGIHCDKKLYERIVKILEKIKPDLVCLEELTHDRIVIKACNDFIEGKISLSKLKRLTEFEKYWFDFLPYKELFSYLKKNKIKIYPIDHKLKERIKLIKLEKKILEKVKKNANISNLKKEEEKISIFDREKEMTKNIIKGIRRYKSKNICVIVGINHAKRLERSLSLLNFKVERKNVSSKKDVDKYLNRIYRYAMLNKVETVRVPPLVPIFTIVFKKIRKTVK